MFYVVVVIVVADDGVVDLFWQCWLLYNVSGVCLDVLVSVWVGLGYVCASVRECVCVCCYIGYLERNSMNGVVGNERKRIDKGELGSVHFECTDCVLGGD